MKHGGMSSCDSRFITTGLCYWFYYFGQGVRLTGEGLGWGQADKVSRDLLRLCVVEDCTLLHNLRSWGDRKNPSPANTV
jgi:hypothetical protein